MNMNEDFSISAGPGLTQMMIKVEDTHVKMPLTVITGPSKGPTVFISTGIHGSEYPGTLAAIELAREIAPDRLYGRLIMVHPVNTQAFRARQSMILPEDGRNINRVFPGSPDGSASEKVAWRISQFQDMADFYLDLHSGDLFEDLHPYVYYPGNAYEKITAASREAAVVLNVPFMVRSSATTGAYNSAALRGTPSLLIERGGAGFCRRSEVDLYKQDVVNVLKHLGLLEGQPILTGERPKDVTEVVYLESAHNGLWQALSKPGNRVKKGDKLGLIMDYFGRTVEEYHAERDGVILYQLYPLSANAGDILVAYCE